MLCRVSFLDTERSCLLGVSNVESVFSLCGAILTTTESRFFELLLARGLPLSSDSSCLSGEEETEDSSFIETEMPVFFLGESCMSFESDFECFLGREWGGEDS